MSDQVPQDTPQGGEGQPIPEDAQPVTLTRKDLQALKNEITEAAFNRSRSYYDQATDKVRSRIKELETSFDVLARAGTPVDDAAKQRAREKLIQEAQAEQFNNNPSAPRPPDEQPPQGYAPPLDPITKTVMDIQTKAGVFLTDEEAKGLDQIPDLYEFLTEVKSRIDRKKASTSSPQDSQPPRVPGALSGPGGDRVTQLTQRLQELQNRDDVWTRANETERRQIVKELEGRR